jgi:uncharacterized protein
MNAEERQLLTDLFERVRGAGAQSRDPQAESFINDAVRAMPFTPYVLAQTVLIQQQALEAASRRIQELQTQGAPQEETSFLGGLGKALFGSPSASAPGAPPSYRPASQQQYAPQQGYAQPQGYPPQPAFAPPPAGPWGAAPQSSGGGFMSGALRTAAGVAGGIAVADLFGNLLGGHGGGGSGLFGNAGYGGGEVVHETVNNYYDNPPEGPKGQDVNDWSDSNSQQDLTQDASFDDSGNFDDGSGGSIDT